MGNFLDLQLDYLFFFYGLSFFLFAAISFFLWKLKYSDFPWFWLGLFGITHGLNEWLDLISVSIYDSYGFSQAKLCILIISFLSLFEFSRKGLSAVSSISCSKTVYLVFVIPALAGSFFGLNGIHLAARYFLGFPSSVFAGLVVYRFSRTSQMGASWLKFLSLALVIYAFATGFIVPKADLFPASHLNYESFFDFTGLPIQLIRAVLVFMAAFFIWMYLQSLKSDELYAKERLRFRSRFTLCFVAILLIFISLGWIFVNYLGSYAKARVAEESRSVLNIISGHIYEDLKKTDEVAITLSGSPWIRSYLVSGSLDDRVKADSVLDRYKESMDVSVAYLLDKDGVCLVSSNRDHPDSFVGKNYSFRPYFKDAFSGKLGSYFAFGITSFEKGYYSGYPVRNEQGQIIGVAVIKKNMTELESYFKAHPFSFLIDPNSVIFLSGYKDSFFSLWPISRKDQDKLLELKQFGDKPFAALFKKEIFDGDDIVFGGQRFYVFRKPISEKGWSLLIFTSAKRISEYRFFGIIIMLILNVLVIVFSMVVLQRDYFLEVVSSSKTKLEKEAAERKIIELALLKKGEELETIIDSSPSFIFFKDKENRFIHVNKALALSMGLPKEQIEGRFAHEILPEHAQRYFIDDLKVIETGKPSRNIVEPLITKDGMRWVQTDKIPYNDEKNNAIGVIGFSLDITERKIAEERLKESEEKYRSLVDNIGIGVALINPRMQVLTLNNQMKKWFPGANVLSICHKVFNNPPSEDICPQCPTCKTLKDGEAHESVSETVIGSEIRNFRIVSTAIKDKEGNIAGAIEMVEDVTEEKRAEETHMRLANIVDSTDDAIISKSLEGDIISWNKGAEKIYGYSQNEMIGKSISLLVPPELSDDTQKIIQKIKNNESLSHYETVRIKKDGTRIYVSLTVSPLKAASGRITGASVIARDITEQTKLDRLKDEFISTVSHELRTPLSITKEGINLILEGIPGAINEKQQKILKASKDNVDRLARIINELLDISRIEAGKSDIKREPVNINELIAHTAYLFEPKIKEKGFEFVFKLPPKGVEIYIDPDKIIQVFTNLLDNAIKFTDKGMVEITVVERLEEIECCIRDTGMGIAKEDLPKVFNKFEQFGRLAGAGEKGTGLGLAIAKGIVLMHKGNIWVESDFGLGSKFCFTIPKYTYEKLMKENIELGIKDALENKTNFSLVVISIPEAENLRDKFQPEVIRQVLKDLEIIVKNNLRRSGDNALKERGELSVFLRDCDKETALRMEGRLEQAIDDYLMAHDLSGKLYLKFGTATFPEEAREIGALIARARNG